MNTVAVLLILIGVVGIVLWIITKYADGELFDDTRTNSDAYNTTLAGNINGATSEDIATLSPVYAKGTPCTPAFNKPVTFEHIQKYTTLSDQEKEETHRKIVDIQLPLLSGKLNEYYNQFDLLVTPYGQETLHEHNQLLPVNTDPDNESTKYLGNGNVCPYILKKYGQYYYYDARYPEKPIDIDALVDPSFKRTHFLDYPVPNALKLMR